LGQIADQLQIPRSGIWDIEPEACISRKLLGEPRQTQVDALARGRDAIILFECKFTEEDGGGCSQIQPLSTGRHKGVRQCNGNYAMQTNPVSERESRCALSAKGITYWDHIPDLLKLDVHTDYSPCPFVGGAYQWMRNLVAAKAMAAVEGRKPAAVILYADGEFPMANRIRQNTWSSFTDLLRGTVTFCAVSYQELLSWAVESALPRDRHVLEDCQSWMIRKVTTLNV
jgi:hypothetical protein